MNLWTAAEAAQATGGQAQGDWQATGVSIDTRTLQPGDLFVALKDARDGHDFVAQALGKGAAAAMVSRVPDGVDPAACLIVDDVLPALERLGAAARARSPARVIAVTGSVGKTSTKEMLRTVLSRQGRSHASVASYNNHWGVPLTLARMPADTDFAVIEIGMNHPGEIAPLSRLARPHVTMITNVAPVHTEAFPDGLAGIAREKLAITAGQDTAGGDAATVICADVPPEALDILEQETDPALRRVWYGRAPGSAWQLRKVTLSDAATVIEAATPRGPVLFKLSVPGRHFATNALGVLAAADALGADAVVAALDLALWLPPEGRGRRERRLLDAYDEATVFELIDDAYNANPTSMAAALDVLAATRPLDGIGRISRGRRVAILGDMLELGPDEAQMHAGLADLASLAAVDVVHCAGPRMRHLHAMLPEDKRGLWQEDATALAAQAHRLVDAGDILLVKGSKGSKVSSVVDALRKLSHPLPAERDGDAVDGVER